MTGIDDEGWSWGPARWVGPVTALGMAVLLGIAGGWAWTLWDASERTDAASGTIAGGTATPGPQTQRPVESDSPRPAEPTQSTQPGTPIQSASPTQIPQTNLPQTNLPQTNRPRAISWAEVLIELDTRRVNALAAHDEQALLRVSAPGSSARAQDAGLAAQIPDGWILDGMALRIASVTVRGDAPVDPAEPLGSVTLLVEDRRSAYQWLTPTGEVVPGAGARGLRHWRVTLRGTPGGWVFVDVSPRVQQQPRDPRSDEPR